MSIQLKQYNRSEALMSPKQFHSHLALYSGYVNAANNLMEISSADSMLVPNNYQLKTQEALNLNGVILHELYFENITKTSNTSWIAYNSEIDKILKQYYDSAKKWLDDFKRCAKISKGWVIFGFEPYTQIYRNIILSTHDTGNIIGFKPLIVLDCYEHAYWMDYGDDKDRYVNKFIENIDWAIVEERFFDIHSSLSFKG